MHSILCTIRRTMCFDRFSFNYLLDFAFTAAINSLNDVSVDRFMSICRWSLTLFIHSILLRFSVTMAVMIRCNSTRLSSFKAGHLPRVAKTMWNNDRTLLMVMWFYVKVLFFQRHLKYLVMAAAISWLRKLRCLSRGGDRYFSFPPAPQALDACYTSGCRELAPPVLSAIVTYTIYYVYVSLLCSHVCAVVFLIPQRIYNTRWGWVLPLGLKG